MQTTAAPATESDLIAEYEAPPGGAWLRLLGARQNNLKEVDLRIPLGTFCCVTGVSGSGKSSLVLETLARAVSKKLHRVGEQPGPHRELIGAEHVNKVVIVDQQPLGSTPASNPATYTGLFEQVRELFARMPDSRIRGYRPARFSFNRPGGRCEDCEGLGQKKIEMHFLPDVWVECTTCRGQRFNQETLAVQYKGHSISDVLNLSIGQALELFENIPKLRAPLSTLAAIGLEYLTLGQSAPTLSGGEAQRVKLAAELSRPDSGRTLYILDEPTTGLHFDDIAKLLKVLNSLVDRGNTVVVIEHNLDVIKTADWIVDVGPEAGAAGGEIVAEGPPEELVARSLASGKRSYTAELLEPLLRQEPRAERDVFDPEAAARSRKGDVDLRKVGRDAAVPWQADGRRWHVRDRVSHTGQPVRWEGAALELVIDALAEFDELSEPNWNHRSIVEVMSREKSGGWFLHAETGDEWLLTLKFRVPKSAFDEGALNRRLGLKRLDDLDELPVYGRGERVRIRNLKGPFQEVVVTVHWQRELETDAFAAFLADAVRAYLGQARKASLNPDDLTPWKVLGQKWHLSRKGFPSNKRVGWDAELILVLAEHMARLADDLIIDWSGQSRVTFAAEGEPAPFAELHTKRREGLDLSLYVPADAFALGRISGLADDRSIGVHRDGRQTIQLRFTKFEHLHNDDWRAFLEEVRELLN
ncbi:MAG: ATP-binding cassette domain-containing protein [Planctomyces sp.]|nr:ATP-binding cassette domain-containing protein [Planctomyces sp.]